MKEVTYEDWMKNPIPRMMWVWDYDTECKVIRKVVYISSREYFPVITIDSIGNIYTFWHCAEIEKLKTRPMTNQELAWWLSDGKHRELKIDGYIYHDYDYKENEQDAEITDFLLIREDDGEWREPLVEVEE